MTLKKLFAIGEVLEIQVVPSDEVRLSPLKSICFTRLGILLGGLSDCEDLVGHQIRASIHKCV